MNDSFYTLPPDLAGDISAYEREVHRFLTGEMPAGVLKAKRVPRGVYEQRRDGTYMVRVRVAGGTVTSRQGKELAALASEYGNGLLHVTTRQDIQLHDISIKDTPAVMSRLMTVGLTCKGGGGNTVRNVTACPYAGICPHEYFDVTPFSHGVTEYLIAQVGSYNLPRKYKIAFSGCSADCALAQVADLGFIAKTRGDRPGFRVVAGGGMGAHSRVADEFLDWVPAAETIQIAETVRRLFDQLGDRTNKQRARLRYIFERIGVNGFRERFVEQMETVKNDGVPEWVGQGPLNDTRVDQASAPPATELIEGVRCLPQRQPGYVAVPLHIPLGLISADDFVRIANAALKSSEEHGLRTTRMQNMLIRFVKRDKVHILADDLSKLGIDVLAFNPLERFVACAGASTCRLGLCMAREAANACARALDDAKLDAGVLNAMDVHINGCPNACGHQPIGPIGLSGVARRKEGRLLPSYRITLGGRCNASGPRLGVFVGQVPAREMPRFLSDLAGDFQACGRDGETFSSYFDRTETAHFEKIVRRHGTVPAYETHSEFYRDFGTEEDFSLAGRGAGECGAGVFEVIQADLATAKNAIESFDIMLPTTRALLITRGVDAQDPDTVLKEFEKHFIDTGLVPDEFRSLLARARGFIQGWEQAFEGYEDSVKKLLDRVALLYSTLDADLKFHPPQMAASGVSERDVTATDGVGQTLDLRGVACPMNFVKAKLRLEAMDAGETLTIVLDDGEPIRNVPASFRNEGQLIEETTDVGDGHWRVVVRKKAL